MKFIDQFINDNHYDPDATSVTQLPAPAPTIVAVKAPPANGTMLVKEEDTEPFRVLTVSSMPGKLAGAGSVSVIVLALLQMIQF
jgi:hypothetical protein